MFLAAASHDLRQPVLALGLFVGALHGVSRDGFRRAAANVGANRGVDHRHERSFQRAFGRLASRRGCRQRWSGGRLPIQSVVDRVSRDFVRAGRDKERLARLESLHRGGRTPTRCSLSVSCAKPRVGTPCATRSADASSSVTGGAGLGSRCKCGTRAWASRNISKPSSSRSTYQLGNPGRDRTKGLGLGLSESSVGSPICLAAH